MKSDTHCLNCGEVLSQFGHCWQCHYPPMDPAQDAHHQKLAAMGSLPDSDANPSPQPQASQANNVLDYVCENCRRAPVADGPEGNSGLCPDCYLQFYGTE